MYISWVTRGDAPLGASNILSLLDYFMKIYLIFSDNWNYAIPYVVMICFYGISKFKGAICGGKICLQ